MPALAKDDLKKLVHEYSLLRLLHHRNKNQHRVATWWKHLNTLKRDLTKLIPMLRTEKGQYVELAFKIKRVDIPKCHRAFHGIVALGQFVNLGLTLLGMLARIDFCVGNVDGLEALMASKKKASMKTSAEEVVMADLRDIDDLGEELGEEIGEAIPEPVKVDDPKKEKKRKIESNSSLESIELKKKKKKKKLADDTSLKGSSDDSKDKKEKKKKKKKKSAIDDIFG